MLTVVADNAHEITEAIEFNNARRLNLRVVPDVRAELVQVQLLNHSGQDNVHIDSAIFNDGPVELQDVAVVLHWSRNNGPFQLVEQRILPLVAVGPGSTAVSFTAAGLAGNNTYRVSIVDPNVDADPTNNSALANILVQGFADLVVAGLSPSTTTPQQGGPLELAVDVENAGLDDAEDVRVEIFANSPLFGRRLVGRTFVEQVGPLASGSTSVEIDTSQLVGLVMLEVVLDRLEKILEISDLNNTATITLDFAAACGVQRAGNRLTVSGSENDDQIEIAEDADGLYVTCGGALIVSLPPGLIRNLVVESLGGHDEVAVQLTSIMEDVEIRGGGGADSVSIHVPGAGGSVTLDGGDGDDSISLAPVPRVAGGAAGAVVQVTGGIGSDEVRMNLPLAGQAALTIKGVKSGEVMIPNSLPLLFDDTELVEALPGQKLDVTVDMNHSLLSGNDGVGDTLEVTSGLSTMNKTLNLELNGVHVVTFSESSINTLTMIGSADADELVITETAAVLPALPGTAAGSHTNPAFVSSGLVPQNVSVHFDGGPGAAEDHFTLVLTTAQNVSIFQDTFQQPGVEPNSGVINVEGAFTLSYESLSPIDVQGAGGSVIVDASLLGRMTEMLVSPSGDGFVLRGDGGFETTTFRGFDDFVVQPPEHVVLQLAGDYNGNDLVEQHDLDLVLVTWGKDAAEVPATWIGPPANTTIDQEELDAVLVNWGNTAAPRPRDAAAEARGAAFAPDDRPSTRAALLAARHAARQRLKREAIERTMPGKIHDAVFAEEDNWLSLRHVARTRVTAHIRL